MKSNTNKTSAKSAKKTTTPKKPFIPFDDMAVIGLENDIAVLAYHLGKNTTLAQACEILRERIESRAASRKQVKFDVVITL